MAIDYSVINKSVIALKSNLLFKYSNELKAVKSISFNYRERYLNFKVDTVTIYKLISLSLY